MSDSVPLHSRVHQGTTHSSAPPSSTHPARWRETNIWTSFIIFKGKLGHARSPNFTPEHPDIFRDWGSVIDGGAQWGGGGCPVWVWSWYPITCGPRCAHLPLMASPGGVLFVGRLGTPPTLPLWKHPCISAPRLTHGKSGPSSAAAEHRPGLLCPPHHQPPMPPAPGHCRPLGSPPQAHCTATLASFGNERPVNRR